MGPVDWTAVAASWLVAAALGVAFYGRAAMPRRGALALHTLAALLLLASVTMIGHMFARVGAGTLQDKPWLYFMMAGGLALTFIGPAMVITAIRRGRFVADALYDAAYWLATFLSVGAVFWLQG